MVPAQHLIAAMKATLILFLATFLNAAQLTLELNPADTKIEWTLEDVLHTVRGTFQTKSGTISFSSEGGKAEGRIVVDAKSGNSGNGMRDRKMNSSVLESDRYPEVSFTPDTVDGTVAMAGTSQVQVHGTFHIHGQDHPIVVPVKASVENGTVKADAHLSIPYASWGMKNPSTLFLKVGDKVELDIHATGHIR
jgi:polyisoprenoid-binding protein YceI